MPRTFTCLLTSAALLLGLASAPARAEAPQPRADELKVTLVARQCDEYTDIMANLARNNIQESLRDLGKNSVYTSGQPIDPSIEEPNDPNCRPLVGWGFEWGGNYTASDPLSTVTGSAGRTPVTKASTPWLDKDGNPTGKSVQAAVTVTLNSQQQKLAQNGNLWVQGGYVSDPLMDAAFGRGTYGFGALRCSVDNLNGDNVETARFPSGYSHIFCYYYAVTPPPTAGKIIVRKQVEGGGAQTHRFHFHGNVSYNPGGAFDEDAAPGAPGSMTFDRGETRPQDDPWEFTEDIPDGWELASLTCDSATDESRVEISGAHAAVTLAGEDTVTCTYTDRRVFSTGISVFKRTYGAVGGPFAFTVDRPGGTTTDLGSLSTQVLGRPELAGRVEDAEAGVYTLHETLPDATEHGYWTADGVECVSATRKVAKAAPTRARTARAARRATRVDYKVDLADTPVNCLFTNTFHPTGKITVEKLTVGGYGRADFQSRGLIPTGEAATSREVGPDFRSVTTAPGRNPASTSKDRLPLGRYFITELHHDDAAGRWELTSITCDGRTQPVGDATATVDLTAAQPNHTCRFTDRFTPWGKLRVEKLIEDPRGVRTGPVKIKVRCSDGQTASYTVEPGRDGLVRLRKPLVLPREASCTVRETADGARGPASVTVRHQVGGGAKARGRTVTVKAGGTKSATVRFIDTYKVKRRTK
ncbi:prealbumin-like fold domain-containing protein [Actinomadura parmotrematis]|uniref:SpaA-like prealbumin fold domain-containing protein n=1 Tax=Actinomadura parmotrematis TaxID=2864039 RepID=A0ABS7G2I4_9ACTN|nr:hypothetical protein [Actinomadura parmotrematis]MBW8486928.1 hypothetical protein [Actinomadura parmotrematis]